MKSTKTIWGIVLIGFGALLIFRNFELLEFNINWHRIADFWPLLLIAVGITSLARNTKMNPWISNSLLAIIIAVFIYNILEIGEYNRSVHSNWEEKSANHSGIKHQQFTLPLDSNITEAELEFDGGAATFNLADTTSKLLEASTLLPFGEYILEKSNNNQKAKIKLGLQGDHIHHKFNFRDKDWKSQVNLKLNPAILWDFDFELGAGDVDFDFSSYKVKSIDMDAGAAALKLKLSALAPVSDVKIDAGASSINVSVPQNARCRVKMNTVLSSRNLQGFNKKEDGVFESDNFNNNSLNLINIDIDAGVSSVSINRY